MSDTVDTREEEQLVDAAKTATDLVAGGMTPNAAIEKIARDSGFGPGKIRLIGYAYNTGQQLGQWRNSGGILDKLASFELVDPEAVIRSIYKSGAEKTAAAPSLDDYAPPPDWALRERRATLEKAAASLPPADPAPAPNPPDPMISLRLAYRTSDRAKQAADEAQRLASASADRLNGKLTQLVGYFRKAAHDRLPFDVVASAGRAYFGPSGTQLLDMVYTKSNLAKRGEKTAADRPPVLASTLRLDREPFTLIKAAIDEARNCYTLRQNATQAVKTAADAKEAVLRPFVPAESAKRPADSGPWSSDAAELIKRAFSFGTEVAAIAAGDILAHKATHQPEDEDPYGDVGSMDAELAEIRRRAAGRSRAMQPLSFGKSASIFGSPAMGAAIGTMVGRTVGTVPQTKDDMVDNAWMDLEDPDHQNELRRIRAHTMLNQLLTDPDEPISGHDPDRVMKAYNEIAQATPRVAENIATLRPILRKHLEGHQEPFEVNEMLNTEKGLMAAKSPTPTTSSLSKTPEKMMG